MRFAVLIIITLSTVGWLTGFSEAAATLPNEPIKEQPASIVIPRDISLGISEQEKALKEIRIIAFGDSGTGDEGQMKVARAMEKFCVEQGCHLGLMLGDNFQPVGVRSVDDPQFIEKFERPYAGIGIPFFAILGAHDWGRKGAMFNWKAQIEYSRRSKFWRMPSDVYSVTWDDLKIIALNTNSFPGSLVQKSWLCQELENSQGRWKLVMGHEHIHAYGYHGDTDFMVKNVLPLLCSRADLYLSSHEHSLQVLKADCGLPLVVSGASSTLRPVKNQGHRALFLSVEHGFTYLIVKENELIVQMVSVEGEVLYQMVIPKELSDRKGLMPASSKQ
jgi:tartrate-resistant acid phosphatase type 5